MASAGDTATGSNSESRRNPSPSEAGFDAVKPDVANPKKHVASWQGFGVFAVLVFAMAVGAVYVRQRIVVVRDSANFNRALETWSDLVRVKRNTPRAVKRFLNRTRYFAMRLRDRLSKPDEPAEQSNRWLGRWLQKLIDLFSTVEKHTKVREPLNEPILVAMSALHHFNPALLRMTAEELNQEAETNDVLKRSIDEHIKKFSQWPPSSEQLQAFREFSAGIDVK